MPIDSSATTHSEETVVDPPRERPSRSAPGPQSGGPPWWIGIVAVVAIGGAIAGGYLLAQTEDAPAQTEPAGSARAGEEAEVEPVEAKVPTKAPAPAPEEELGDAVEDLAPAASAEEAELAAKTGFDLLVEPSGANVSLNGHPVGTAPLRVRNLLAGSHSIDVEGPEGYFGQHQEIELEAGESMVLRLALVPLSTSPGQDDGAKPEPTEPLPAPKSPAKAKRSSKSKSRTRAPSAKEESDLASKGQVSLGSLMLGAKPPCEIIINGKNTGLTTPQRAIQLPEGIHRVVLVSKEHGIRKSFKVRIKAGRITRAIQDLTKTL